jgi:NADPH2:quinone reductase
MAKAILIRRHGGPEVLDYTDVDLGPPDAGEIQVRQTAVGLNFIDVYLRQGSYPSGVPPLPFVPGAEAAGTVIAVGPGVADLAEGDRVAYGTVIGAYAAERNVPADKVVKLPASISDEVGAVIMLKGLTAQYLLRRTHRVKPGDVILVHAAAGGVGLMLCQWGKALGATVIGTVGSREKAAVAQAHGCDHPILYREEDFVSRVRDFTKGELCDVVYDGVGKDTFPASLECIKPFGLFASFGSASGAIENFSLSALSANGSLYATRPTLFTHARKRADLLAMTDDLFDAIATGKLTPDISARYPLADAALAHTALESRATTGSIILVP